MKLATEVLSATVNSFTTDVSYLCHVFCTFSATFFLIVFREEKNFPLTLFLDKKVALCLLSLDIADYFVVSEAIFSSGIIRGKATSNF